MVKKLIFNAVAVKAKFADIATETRKHGKYTLKEKMNIVLKYKRATPMKFNRIK